MIWMIGWWLTYGIVIDGQYEWLKTIVQFIALAYNVLIKKVGGL